MVIENVHNMVSQEILMTWLLKRKRKRYENLNLNKVVMEMVISIAKKSDLEEILVKQRLMCKQ